MIARRVIQNFDPLWVKISAFTSVIFFIFLSDSLLSYWVPIHLQNNFNSPFAMGLVMGFSSLVGLFVDLVLPQVVRKVQTVKLIIFAGITSVTFTAFLAASTFFPILIIFLFAMASWGIYYELLGFAQKQFVSGAIPKKFHAAAWAFLFTFRSLAYTLGPFFASTFLAQSAVLLLTASIFLTVFGYLLILLLGLSRHSHKKSKKMRHLSILAELSHWKVLGRSIWPIIVLSLLMGVIDSTFWTSGTVLSESLAEKSVLGEFFLPAYMAPSLFVGFLVIKWKPEEGKERKALLFFLVSSVFLSLIGATKLSLLILLLVFASSTLSAFTYPLLDGVYADVIARMGRQRLHLMGLTSSASSIAYIMGPPLAGLVSSKLGEQATFSVIGVASLIVGAALFFALPKRIELPQSEIRKWK